MKFFTLDVYNSWYSTYEDSSQITAAYQAYQRSLKGLQDVLPAQVMTLTQLRGVDDGLVVEARHDLSQRALTLTLRCGDLQMGYYDLVLQYDDADIAPQDEWTLAQIARTTLSDRRHESDLYTHEVDVLTDGRLEHRLLFHPGLWFSIRCRTLQWTKVDRPDRKLPRSRNRFPGDFVSPL